MKFLMFHHDTIKIWTVSQKRQKTETFYLKSISEKILAQLAIPSGKKFSPDEVQNLLELESLGQGMSPL